jgi:hypothetical protein
MSQANLYGVLIVKKGPIPFILNGLPIRLSSGDYDSQKACNETSEI